MIAALRGRDFNEFSKLLEEKSNVKYLENEEIVTEIHTSCIRKLQSKGMAY